MNLLALETFRRILGWNPFHFWGMSHPSLVPVTSSCGVPLTEYAWQASDAVGRTEIRAAIESAEQKLQDYLGYAVGARWASVDVPWPASFNPSYRPWYAQSVQLPNEGYVAAFGIEQRTLVGSDAVAYSDTDGDGLNDTFTLSVATTVTDSSRLQVFVPEADQVLARTMAGERWQLVPVQVTIAGGTATIKGPAWLCVRPALYESQMLEANGIDPTNAANFLTTLDVMEVTTGGDQGSAFYDAGPYPGWCCGPANGDPSAVSTGSIRSALVQGLYGIVQPVVSVQGSGGAWYAAPYGEQCRPPDRVRLNIYAGVPRNATGDIQADWATIVARLALAELTGQSCGCKPASHQWDWWQTDVSRTSGPDQFAFKEQSLNNPLGTKRGHIDAWQAIQRRRHAQALTTA